MKDSRNNSTVFVSGFSLRSNPKDKIAILSLMDTLSNDDENINFTYALPLSILEEIRDGIEDAIKDIENIE
ncbi:MAG: hypothetical protein L0G63_13085 [Psychrobacter sp.]|uniref:hypothetical protein n=1 Tax=Psychrobacter sp. TaxID=56811 RepID=UPI00264841DF|nr:hypothetical protein [Psychrobacter sp.]MDN5621380.1 hypothetical protein [Psychrobacter sp.]